jgi:hypothetical protein
MLEKEWLACTNPHGMLEYLATRPIGSRHHLLALLGLCPAAAHERKLRLFAVACCRRFWPLLTGPCRAAVEICERYVDGHAGRREWKRAILAATAAALEANGPWLATGPKVAVAQARAAEAALAALSRSDPAQQTAAWAREVARALALEEPTRPAEPVTPASGTAVVTWGAAAPPVQRPAKEPARGEAAWTAEARLQCELLREIFGNPFRPVHVEPSVLRAEHGALRHLAQAIYDERRFHDLPTLADALERMGSADSDLLAHCRQLGEHVRGCWAVDAVLGKG